MNNYRQACCPARLALFTSLSHPPPVHINFSPISSLLPKSIHWYHLRLIRQKMHCSFAALHCPLSLLFFCLLFLLLPASEACASNGICGGGGCCGAACSPSPVACNPSSCQPGYTCGQYGCARNKARSALTRKDGLIVSVEDFLANQTQKPLRNIYGFERRKLPLAGEERPPLGSLEPGMYLKLTNPNYLFRQCCEDRRLPDACLWKCHFNTYTKEVLQLMFFKNDPCPIEAAADLQYCAAQGRDHSECCTKMGIGKTVAGDKCLTFCDQRAGKVTKLDYSYLPCYDHFEKMKRCFYDEIKSNMETKLRPRLSGI